MHGVLAYAFETLAEAFAWGETQTIDAFVVNVSAGNADATAEIGRIREHPRYADVPLVAVLGAHQVAARPDAYHQGADDVLVRPFASSELTVRLGRRLALHAARLSSDATCARLEQTLHDHDRRAVAQGKRIETLWRLANDATSAHPDLVRSMLDEGTHAIRDNAAFHGTISTVEGDEVVILVAAASDWTMVHQKPTAGFRFPVEGSLVGETRRFGMTRAWADIRDDPNITSSRVHLIGWRSAVCTPFNSLGNTYFLTFTSQQTLPDRFTSDDYAYCDLLATFFAGHFQQQWQRERLQFQNAHDVLTGTLNSVYFRSEARMGMIDATTFAIIVVELVAFAHVNATYGFQTGDALLVEVAAAMQHRALPAERIGRVSAQGFAVFIPVPQDATTLDERIDDYRAIFPRPFSTGDRNGREFVTLDGALGVARSGIDGTTFDVLLSHASAEATESARRV